jgi:hypothetical protein
MAPDEKQDPFGKYVPEPPTESVPPEKVANDKYGSDKYGNSKPYRFPVIGRVTVDSDSGTENKRE